MVTRLTFYRRKRRGVIVATELILIVTILCFALAVGLSAVRQAIVGELLDVATALSRVESDHEHKARAKYRLEPTGEGDGEGVRVFLKGR